jgi:prepilin-type N-terminal cleavage/methylation domain-containing protein
MWANMNTQTINKQRRDGFTIVELLIVIVVIGILAAITIVAYNGIQDRARVSATNSALTQANKKIRIWQASNSDQFPSTLTDAGITESENIALQYTSDNTANPKTYCVTATYGTLNYYIDSSGGAPKSGVCTGYNLLVWNKTKPGATIPIPSAAVDTTVYRTSTASMRLGPSSTSQPIAGNPYGDTAGQTYTVSFWIRTDANWNGLNNNSKIRFGDANTSALLTACGYGGVKTTWQQITCSYTLTASSPQVAITVGNDGSVGNIWIDDLIITRSN